MIKHKGLLARLVIGLGLLAFPAIVQAQHGHHHHDSYLIIDNDTNDDLDIYVDHDYVGEVRQHEHEKRFRVSPGHHELEAKCHEGRRWGPQHIDLGNGNSYKWRLI